MQEESQENYWQEQEEDLTLPINEDNTDFIKQQEILEIVDVDPIKTTDLGLDEIINKFESSGRQLLVVENCDINIFNELYVKYKKDKTVKVSYNRPTSTLTMS